MCKRCTPLPEVHFLHFQSQQCCWLERKNCLPASLDHRQRQRKSQNAGKDSLNLPLAHCFDKPAAETDSPSTPEAPSNYTGRRWLQRQSRHPRQAPTPCAKSFRHCRYPANRPEINITTIEDPVEIRINGLNQIEIDPKTTFAESLRTVLRQDPDIILVGEIRDTETAEIAMQAGQTGHYVLSTIHTIDAIEVITRLRKMGVSNYDISSTLATTVSQRLVRRLCKNCAKERDFTQEEKDVINKIGEKYNVKFD